MSLKICPVGQRLLRPELHESSFVRGYAAGVERVTIEYVAFAGCSLLSRAPAGGAWPSCTAHTASCTLMRLSSTSSSTGKLIVLTCSYVWEVSKCLYWFSLHVFFVFVSALRCDDFVVRGLYGCFVCGSELTLCWLLKQGRFIRSCSGADCRIQFSATGCQVTLFGFSQSAEVEGLFKSVSLSRFQACQLPRDYNTFNEFDFAGSEVWKA